MVGLQPSMAKKGDEGLETGPAVVAEPWDAAVFVVGTVGDLVENADSGLAQGSHTTVKKLSCWSDPGLNPPCRGAFCQCQWPSVWLVCSRPNNCWCPEWLRRDKESPSNYCFLQFN